MDNLFHTSEKMKYISAKLYYLQGKYYSVVEAENNFFFGRQNGDMLESITVFSRDALFLCNDSRTNVYAIEIIEEQLKITVLPEQNEHIFELSSADEFVIGLSVGNHSLLIKTCRDLSDDGQKINMYFIDTKKDRIMLCNDIVLNKSYNMPYISICGDEEYISAESAEIYPYEIDEAKNNTSFMYKNDILTVRLRSLMEAISKNEELKWNVIFSAKEGYYVNILRVNGPHIWYLETTVDETKTNIVKYDLSNGLIESNLFVENRIDKAVFNEDKLLCMYKWNSSKEMIDIYNDQGEIISNLDYSALMIENGEIELNDILSILDEEYVVFDATDYSEDESYQCRVVYDITNNQFMICNNSYIEFKGLIY